MPDNDSQSCTHLDRKIPWLGVRIRHGRKRFVFRCQGCGQTFCTQRPFTRMTDVRPLMNASLLA
ncbi:MAG TPA: hypothetical protein VMY39_02950 [Planctomycetota bacterium]|nr:hypothetical protein [Planctomycetota bacterium]HUV38539.1 hypothetical protein [Planctomycetota bacterium]